jgi:hypothetical protein
MELVNGELGVSTERCVTSNVDRNGVTGVAAEGISDIKEEDQEPTTIPEIKTEPEVSCMALVIVMHILYRLYPELHVLVKKD